MPTSVIAGFALGFSLILAIGAQNAFILRQGLRREHVFFLCLTCAVSDAILIGAGVAGFGTLAQAAPWFETVMRYGGAAFLTWYGLRSLRSSWLGGSVMEICNGKRTSLKAALLTVFAFTWLNPHVYLDTVVLIGSISAQYDDRLGFALGAMTSSFVFFFSLGYGASILSPVFARPRAWQVLDAGIGVVMLGIALKLVTM
ncbi:MULTISPECIES: LysE/ArgO family amino acid transporter [unclassified Ruegeria]|uniref:LysE/ArgO family amino acid transporter n=1 Tax=unclassified Ruegeria TaxID=2625375 RepID=UPI001487A464|nr:MULTISPECIES: LysE/ArgO family amino acid transporter [unclassified Ruegeria]NOC91428.1 LysE family transporter [Ruegeria sp. HKCCD6604]